MGVATSAAGGGSERRLPIMRVDCKGASRTLLPTPARVRCLPTSLSSRLAKAERLVDHLVGQHGGGIRDYLRLHGAAVNDRGAGIW
jgi:hypothetical protein